MKGIKRIKLFALGLLLMGSMTSMISGSWEHLGTRTVQFGLDHDKIVVTAKEGRFAKLKINVNGNLNLHKVKVNFRNGTSQILNTRHNFVKGANSKVLDLKGGKRVIQSVDFWYDTKNRSRRRAIVHVYGRH
ncbi:MAG: hypothetical protein KJP21_09855 [Bacteroidia bacterium]|nr:hypothetical protein [Bacteroidia bacterium]NNJ55688.1 hypothetical protein [Bacteroidia bacterium]